MRILILGDVHGNVHLLPAILRGAQEQLGIEAAIQVGDFGFQASTIRAIPALPIPLHAIDGNHEDHVWLQRHMRQRRLGRLPIRFHPRGSILSLGGLAIGLIGGALHADRPQDCQPFPNWVTEADAQRAIDLFNRVRPAVIVSHSCPHSIGVGMHAEEMLEDRVARYCHAEGHLTGPPLDCGEPGLTTLWNGLDYRPVSWLFGHFHRWHQRTVDGCAFVCVGSSDESDGVVGVRPVVLDTSSAQVFCHDDLRL